MVRRASQCWILLLLRESFCKSWQIELFSEFIFVAVNATLHSSDASVYYRITFQIHAQFMQRSINPRNLSISVRVFLRRPCRTSADLKAREELQRESWHLCLAICSRRAPNTLKLQRGKTKLLQRTKARSLPWRRSPRCHLVLTLWKSSLKKMALSPGEQANRHRPLCWAVGASRFLLLFWGT